MDPAQPRKEFPQERLGLRSPLPSLPPSQPLTPQELESGARGNMKEV